ncbi:MAG: DM13 domain-containing protein [Gammaproteobacteria bacterium]|nr:DM13 domain-containing protein [Gammaproteobacteria bacterium]MBU1722507.1 DM13 domain-containing protein [Gammaproteobacteria bacterium]MBU2007028.1 DM13 domain-containing protein [Gammaproteobacteria bacterium]
MKKLALLLASHIAVGVAGFMGGIYVMPILTASSAPIAEELADMAAQAVFKGEFRRDLPDSDFLHWGEGKVFITPDAVALQGRLAPGPDYKLYLSPEFVGTKADFLRLKERVVRVGDVNRFNDFIVPLPDSIDPAAYNSVIVWCETFQTFITAAEYQ